MSKQDYGTPPEFIEAVQLRFGLIAFDLAASPHNAVDARYFTEADNALVQDWYDIGAASGDLLWLNPPFRHISPWAEKCAAEAKLGTRVAMLVPASVGSHWFANHVLGNALVLTLAPRLTFVGCSAPYPKDLMLCLFGPAETSPWIPAFGRWRWK